jgi:hypothetical protein
MGEKIEIVNKLTFSKLKGIKIPLINNKGNLIIFINNIISEVISVGLADTSKPNKDPKRDIIHKPVIKAIIWIMERIQTESKRIKTTVIIREITIE